MSRFFRMLIFCVALTLAVGCLSVSAYALPVRALDVLEGTEVELSGIGMLASLTGSTAYIRQAYTMKTGQAPQDAFYEGMLLRLARMDLLGAPLENGDVFATDAEIARACARLIKAEPWSTQDAPECPCITRGEGGYVFDVSSSGGVVGAYVYSVTALEDGLYDVRADVYECDPEVDTEAGDILSYDDQHTRWVGHLNLRALQDADAVFGFAVTEYSFTLYSEHVTYGYVHSPDGEAEVYIPSVFRRSYSDSGFSGVTRDGTTAALYMTVTLNGGGITLEDRLNTFMAAHEDASYREGYGGYSFIVSWERDDRAYTLMEYVTDEAIYSLSLEYDKRYEPEYSLYMELILNSFTVKAFGVG